MALLTAGNVFVGAGYTLIVIVIAQQRHATPTIIGLIFSIGGVGGILGAAATPWVRRRFSFRQIVVGTMWLFALLWLPLVTTPAPLMLGLITAALFFIAPLYNVVYVSLRLALTPDALQSRVNSVARLIGFGLAPLGWALTGILLEHTGPRFTTLLCTVGLGLLALVGTVNPHIRDADPH
jgi:predicted MFS family arabinose efflux permease